MPGTFKFTWAHPAEEVYVTGTFDNWTKSEKLEKVGDRFEKDVTLSDATQKIYYKFVVDNNWITDHTAPSEPDHEGNVNNFLTPEQIVKEEPTAATTTMSNIGPDATTAALAKDVPLENKDDKSAEANATPTGGPGGFPATPADELDKTVSVNPLPATDVTQPSVVLAPGEPIPPSAKAGDINAGVTLDKESYEKSDRLPGLTDENSQLPETSATTIPESGLPMPAAAIAAATITSVGPESTTAGLAADVPKETKVPEVVKESQEKADAPAEASAQPLEVAEKAAVEEELKEKVPEAPSTAEGTAGFGTEKSEKAGIAATAVTAGGIALAAAAAAKDAIFAKSEPAATQAAEATTDAANKASEAATDLTSQASVAAATAANDLPEGVKEQLPESVQSAIKSQASENARQEIAPNVPEEVKESVAEAAKSPEAAANAAAVEDKKDVEAELLQAVKPAPAADEEAKSKSVDVKGDLKAAVDESQNKPAEASAAGGPSTTAVTTKPGADSTEATSETTAVTTKPVSDAAAKDAAQTAEPKKETNGSTAAADSKAAPSTPVKAESASTPSSANAASSEKKKKNRLSAFFGKIKSKVSHKD